MAGRVALVTGASRGLGAAAAVELARLGAHCVLVARTQGGLEETDDAIRRARAEAGITEEGGATLLPLDLVREAERIDMIGPSVVGRFGRLDILVHAAGALPRLTPVGHIQPKDWAEAIGVNLAAAWRLIRACDPPLRAAPAGRAVFVTDAVAAEPAAYWGLYGAGKAGMEHLARTWAAEVAGSGLRVNLFAPGPMRTRLRRAAFPGDDPAAPVAPAERAAALAALCLPTETRHGALVR
ncbi:SDR family NAD(P)-dependent oxidoreductase [Roseomonas sp. NAR14]|uniref:SDR family NAD(P)-dependent oxidoreductase n=1 Tax=Roseomonas acroporae TaxID=2937791 RepID=A0A9X2BWK7_9PROT|nr:SDR family NAD(P)-dependent oxidoreductase [Roseomonas acroporae]MCK8783990.1 SDR family NAD(P)-dependent oxidoreductase [Roseomonas acroporae]